MVTDSPARLPVISDYPSALEYLNGTVNHERTRATRLDARAFKLDRMRALVDRLDNPERDTRFILIAGSKGKGSVTEMVASCLSACRYAVGVYTSPHLVDVRERIRIGQQQISEEDFVRLTERIAHAGAGLPESLGSVTYFELLTAMALLYFAEQAVDVAVLEVGLGGRLDATNIVTPEVCGITAIQLEHTHILGDTLEKIAAEKAGIIKPGVAVVSVPQPPGVLAVIREHAQRVSAPMYVLGEDIEFSHRFEATPELGPHVRVCVASDRARYEHLPVPLPGEHQAYNCGLALSILDRLQERGFEAPERDVAIGLAATRREGRMEMIWNDPRIMLDGAHTPESIEALMRSIGAHVRYDSMVVVFGCCCDKNINAMLDRLAVGADKVIFTRSENPRAESQQSLLARFADCSHKMAQHAPTVREAINLATRAVGRDDLIVVTGSVYLIGEARRLLREARARRPASVSR